MDQADIDRSLVVGARRILAAKLAIHATLPAGYLSDPAVALLLALFILRADDTPATLDAVLAEAVCVSRVSADRWLRVLESDGLTDMVAEGERTRIALTGPGVAATRAMIVAVGKAETAARDAGVPPGLDAGHASHRA